MVKAIEIVDHVSDGNNNLLEQYKESPLFVGFIDSFTSELNDLETEFSLFTDTLPLISALGANLDQWGIILQADQRPTDDEEFRVLLFALVGAYYSEGHAQDIRALVLQVLQADGIFIDDNGQATFSFTVFNPTFTFGAALVSQIVNLAKPAGVEFLGFTISDQFSQETFSFDGDIRPNSSGFGVAVAVEIPLTNWVNYVYAPNASISDSRRIFYTTNATTKESSITFVTDVADTTWLTDLALSYEDTIGAIIGWVGLDGAFYNIVTISSDANLIDDGVVGDSQFTRMALIDGNGLAKAIFKRNNQIQVASEIGIYQSGFEYDETDGPITLAQTLQDGVVDPVTYGIRDGGRYSIFI